MIRKGYSVVLLAAIAVTGATVTAFACGDEKGTSASNASVKSASADHCAGKAAKATAVTANHAADHCAKPSAATAVSASACCKTKGAKASATTAMANGKAILVNAGSSSCASKSTNAGFDAVVTGNGSSCAGKSTSAVTSNTHGCDACADVAMCESELKSVNSQYQVVPLKNGVMYVYTASDARDVRSVQSAIARRTDRINSLVSVQNAKLCPECKRMRGAMASGKLTREVVNIEGGSISLVTSSDPTMVSRLYAMAGLSGQKVVKS